MMGPLLSSVRPWLSAPFSSPHPRMGQEALEKALGLVPAVAWGGGPPTGAAGCKA